MFERLMTEQRNLVVGALMGLCGLTLLLWLIRGPRPLWANVPFLAVSMLLTPFAFFVTVGFLYLALRAPHISVRAFRVTCGGFFIVGVGLLTLSALSAVGQFVNHRPISAANFLALGLALGAMKAWELPLTAREPR